LFSCLEDGLEKFVTGHKHTFRSCEHKMGEACDTYGGKRNTSRDLVGKSEEDRRLQSLILSWDPNQLESCIVEN
jgi:hypothetical protein